MNAEDFRRAALEFPETAESSHMGHPDFRVRGKIFATIYPDGRFGMVKLTPEQQDEFVHDEPKVYAPAKGGWGRQGCTTVRLSAARKGSVRRALAAAWCKAAPKRLAREFEGSS